MIVDEEVYLGHHGVKGQKWGVRRQRLKEARKRQNIKTYGDKTKPHTKAQREARQERNTRRVRTGARVAIGAAYVAASIARKQAFKENEERLRAGGSSTHTTARGAKTVKDILNSERDVKVSSLKRMHAEGKMDDNQAKNFLKILNDRYDRKIADAAKGGGR